jgi:hypothetical protein
MYCNYCNEKEGIYELKNGKKCCQPNYQSCPGIIKKSSEILSEKLKTQYQSGKRVSHFRIFNDGLLWKDRKHTEKSKDKISSARIGKKMDDSFKKNRSEEMKKRYESGWECKAGRCKKIKYSSPIAGDVLLDGTWELKTAIYLDENKFNWRRNKKRFDYIDKNNKKRTYCPDFYLIDHEIYIEVKGYQTELDLIKWKQFSHNLEIWDKKILKDKKIL